MYVQDWMVKNIVTATNDIRISEALDIFEKNAFHRLPIVDGSGKLIGLITEGIIQANTPSRATSLSMHELNYLLSKTSVASIMIRDVITIGPKCLLEEAADVMSRHDISCLPVVDDVRHLIGIITQKDIFNAFIALLGYYETGTRVAIEVSEDKTGVLANIAALLAQANVSISHLAVYRNTVVDVVIRVSDPDQDKIVALLQGHGYKITDVRRTTLL